MIDPILPLSVSIAEGRRAYAFFLGSGISKAASIPTGGEIFWNTVRKLYQLERESVPEDEQQLEAWFQESEYRDFTYSKILEALRPEQEERRSFLEKYFVGKSPTKAHEQLADLVGQKLVKIIVTTNFDQLMERILEDKGVSFDIVASAADLEQVIPREHANCRILKIHGDYKRLNIRNTERLLEVFETLIRSIESRHGSTNILSIPFAIACRLFYTWGAQCIARENLDFLKQMFSYQFPYKGDYRRLVDKGKVFHPLIHGNPFNDSFDYVKEKLAAQSYLQESFPELARNSLGYLCQFDLINCFRALKENTYLRLPNFLRFDKGQYESIRLKILRNPNFAEALAEKVFNESREDFLAHANDRLANLRHILSQSGFSPIMWDSLEEFIESEP